MIRVYSSLNSLLVDNLYNLLQQQDIACEVRNRHGSSMVGEIPISEAFTELWVDAENSAAAARLIEDALRDDGAADSAKPWTCPACGTVIEPPFDTCWHCATADGDRQRPDDREPVLESAESALKKHALWIGWLAAALLALWWMSGAGPAIAP